MRRPLLWVAAAFALGITAQPWLPAVIWWILTAVALAGVGRRVLPRRAPPPVAAGAPPPAPPTAWGRAASPAGQAAAILIAIVGLGALAAAADQRVPRTHYWQHVAPMTLVGVEGVVVSDPVWRAREGRPAAQQAIVAVMALRQGDAWRRASGRVWLRHHRPRFPLRYGDRLHLTGLLRRPRPAQAPGVFDEARWLWLQQVDGVVEAGQEGVEWLAPAQGWRRGVRALYDAKHHAIGVLHQRVDRVTAALVSALLLGDRTTLPRPVTAWFRDTGTIHLLSISGWHVTWLGGLLWFLSRAILPRRRAAVATTAGLVAYCVLAGAQPPIVRATLMGALVMLGLCLRRPVDPMNALGFAAAAILAAWPRALWDLGFQLSFVSVWMLLAFAPAGLAVAHRLVIGRPACGCGQGKPHHRLPAWSRPAIRWGVLGFFASTAVWLGTWPLVAYHLHRVTLVAWLANLAAIPLASLVLVTGLLVVAGTWAPAWLLLPWAGAAQVSTAALLGVLQGCAAVPWATFPHGPWPGWAVLAWSAGLAVVAQKVSRIDMNDNFVQKA